MLAYTLLLPVGPIQMLTSSSCYRQGFTVLPQDAPEMQQQSIPRGGRKTYCCISGAHTNHFRETLNMNPDPKKSNLFVYGPGGELISQGNARVSFSNPQQMSVPIKPNWNGVYIVHWVTVSAVDGDPIRVPSSSR